MNFLLFQLQDPDEEEFLSRIHSLDAPYEQATSCSLPHDKLVELRRIVAEAGSLLIWNDKHMNWRDRRGAAQRRA